MIYCTPKMDYSFIFISHNPAKIIIKILIILISKQLTNEKQIKHEKKFKFLFQKCPRISMNRFIPIKYNFTAHKNLYTGLLIVLKYSTQFYVGSCYQNVPTSFRASGKYIHVRKLLLCN